MDREFIQCKIPIECLNLKNRNDIIIPDDVFKKAIQDIDSIPIVIEQKAVTEDISFNIRNETCIGVIHSIDDAFLWGKIEPDILIKESHKDGGVLIIDDMNFRSICISQ